jgi:RHS repeat-associated protein
MQWEHSTGNLLQRHDVYKYKIEQFTYDNLDRLTVASVNNGQPDITLQYMPNGSPAFFDIPAIMNYGDYNNPGPKNAVVNAENNNQTISTDIQHIQFTSFKQPRWIKENGYEQNFWYGSDMQRRKSVLKLNQQQIEERIYLGSYERVKIGTQTHLLHYVYAGGKLIAIVNQNRGGDEIYYTYTDHLGSIVALTNANGVVVAEQNFDAWGNARNPDTWKYENIPAMPAWFNRGYTGHEHMPHFALINMNGRMYDPLLNRMLSPDNFVQAPFNTQNYNRYSYAFNNPLKYTDPDGEIFLLFTDFGYEIQKYFSLVSVKINLGIGSERFHLGFETSIGVPKSIPFSYRWHWGSTYYSGAYDNGVSGHVSTNGREITYAGFFSLSSTQYHSKGEDGTSTSQTTGRLMVGVPLFNVKYQNDWQPEWMNKMALGFDLHDGGDRFRTAALQINFGMLKIGFNLFTGDPGLIQGQRVSIPGTGIHEGKLVYTSGNSDDYRSGILYLGFGPYRFGVNSEDVRHGIQNVFSHNILKPGTPHFQVLDRTVKFYWYFGSGYGTGLY